MTERVLVVPVVAAASPGTIGPMASIDETSTGANSNGAASDDADARRVRVTIDAVVELGAWEHYEPGLSVTGQVRDDSEADPAYFLTEQLVDWNITSVRAITDTADTAGTADSPDAGAGSVQDTWMQDRLREFGVPEHITADLRAHVAATEQSRGDDDLAREVEVLRRIVAKLVIEPADTVGPAFVCAAWLDATAAEADAVARALAAGGPGGGS